MINLLKILAFLLTSLSMPAFCTEYSNTEDSIKFKRINCNNISTSYSNNGLPDYNFDLMLKIFQAEYLYINNKIVSAKKLLLTK
jgi:hypothetical protein